MAKEMKTVAIESPYAGDVEYNEKYGRACMADCLKRGEAPYASHLLYTQPGVLDDTIPEERTLGMEVGKAIEKLLDATIVYTDLGISSGMEWGIKQAQEAGRRIEYRELGGSWAGEVLKPIKSLNKTYYSSCVWDRSLVEPDVTFPHDSAYMQQIIHDATIAMEKNLHKKSHAIQFSELVEILAIGIPEGYEVVLQESDTVFESSPNGMKDGVNFFASRGVKVKVLPQVVHVYEEDF